MPWRLEIAQRVLIWRIGELVLMLVLGGIVILLGLAIQDVRRQTIQSQLQAEHELEGIGAAVAIGVELDRRQDDLDRIVAYLPDKAGIGSVVAALEQQAARYDVLLKIPVVQEVRAGDGKENVEQMEGQLRGVQLQVVVRGAPEQVLRFFYSVEHLPYLLAVKQWRFGVTEVAPSLASMVPSSGPSGRPGAAQKVGSAAESQLADLTLDLFLTILGADDESRS